MEARWQFTRLGWAYVGFVVTASVADVILTMILMGFMDPGQLMDSSLLISQASMYLVGFPVFYLLVRRLPAWRLEEPETVGMGTLLGFVLFCIGITYLGNYLGQLLMSIVYGIGGAGSGNPVEGMIETMDPVSMFLSVVVIAPVMEELMFRRLLVDRTVQYGQKTAVLVSGLAFGLFHGNFYQFFYAAALGMVFAYLYSSTGKISYNIFLHMAVNLIGGFVPLLLTEAEQAGSPLAVAGTGMLLVLMAVSILFVIVTSIRRGRQLFFFPGWAARPERGMARTILTAPGVIGFLALCGLTFVMAF